jgi:hypothetical protein
VLYNNKDNNNNNNNNDNNNNKHSQVTCSANSNLLQESTTPLQYRFHHSQHSFTDQVGVAAMFERALVRISAES